MKSFTTVTPAEMGGNPFDRIGKDWMLITAGDAKKANTMTASWGGLGVLWNKPVVFAFVRPTRYTYEFLEREDTFSLSFFPDESTRAALTLCGRVSGRDTDKIAAAGLHLRTDAEAPYFDEADTVLLCRKLAVQDIDPAGFIDPSIHQHYHNDYHRVYVGEILRVLKADGSHAQ